MKESKIAFCIPTYNRSLIVAEFLEQSASLFYQFGIDIYYYDSSVDNKTEVVVKRWMDSYENIYYIRIPTDWHANYKVLYIYKQYAQNQMYDYIWICGDSVRCSGWLLQQVTSVLELKYDMIVINGSDEGRIGTREYTDGNELFQDCAWYMTLFGAVILNIHTILGNVKWSCIEEKYGIPECINYSHIGLYFETIYILDKFRAFYLAADQEISGSKLKIKAGWYQDAFEVLCKYWPSTVDALPDYYTNKWSAISKLGYYSCLKPLDFFYYRLENVYNIHTFFKYRKILKRMSYFSTFQLWILASLKPKLAYCIVINDLNCYVREMQKIRRLHNFCRRNQAVYIYGAGIVAERFAKYLQKNEMILQGFVVTQKENNPDKFYGYPVISLCEFQALYNKMGIIIGLNQQNMNSIKPILMECGIWEHSYHEYIMPIMLLN